MLREYIWLDDKPLAVIDSTGSSKVTYFIHSGHLNEPQMMTNASKAKVDIRLPGQWYQAEAAGSGLNQNHHRDYDPSLGRYIQVDPLGIDAGQNPYAYVDGKPYDLRDPQGLDVVTTFKPLDGAAGLLADHQAVYVGNDQTGWTYQSKNGVEGNPTGFSGPAAYDDANGQKIASYEDVLADAKRRGYDGVTPQGGSKNHGKRTKLEHAIAKDLFARVDRRLSSRAFAFSPRENAEKRQCAVQEYKPPQAVA